MKLLILTNNYNQTMTRYKSEKQLKLMPKSKLQLKASLKVFIRLLLLLPRPSNLVVPPFSVDLAAESLVPKAKKINNT